MTRRPEILERWRRKRAAKEPLQSGTDFIVFPSTSGRSTLEALMPFGDANGRLLKDAPGVLSKTEGTPVIACVCGTDPLRLMDKFLQEVAQAGYAGVQNFPSVGLIDGTFRTNLEEAHLGYAREIEMIRLARERGLLTAPLVFTPEEAAQMAEAGADLLVVHPGLGAARAKLLDDVRDAAIGVARDILILAHASLGDVASADGVQS